MKQYYIPFFLMLLTLNAKAQLNHQEVLKDSSLQESLKQTKMMFTRAIQGYPVVVPLPQESDSTIFLMPVSDCDTVPKVDRLYLVDNTRGDFSFERDIYMVHKIERTDNTIIAMVTNVCDGKVCKIEIDDFLLHEIRLINRGKWKYPSNIKIPVISFHEVEMYKPHRAEK